MENTSDSKPQGEPSELKSEEAVSENAKEKVSVSEEAEAAPEKPAFFQSAIEKIKLRDYGNSIARLLTAWIMTALLFIIILTPEFNTFDFFNKIKMPVYIILIAVIFVILSVINKHNIDKILLFVSTLVYGCYAIDQDRSFYFAVGSCILMGGVAVYCTGDWIKFRFKKYQAIAAIAAFGVIFTLFTGGLTALNHRQHYSSCYDFGIFSQMFSYMKDTLLPMTTCERDRLLSHFAVHFSPIYYLMLPAFFVFPTPETLLICQGLIIASGLIPLYLICRQHKLSNNATVIFSLCYVLLPSMANGCFYYLHENKFLAPLILWLAYALEKNSWALTIITAMLVMIVKEDAPVYVAIMGLYFLMSRRRISKGIITMILAVVYFVTVSYFMSKYGLGTMNYRYSNFMYDGSDSLVTVIKAVILNPIYTVKECFDEEKITFFLQMMVPLAFMPFMIKKPSRVILLMPLILINLMSDYQYQHDIGFQYTYASASFLIYLCVMNYEDMKPEFRKKMISVAAASSVFMYMNCTYYRLDIIDSYKANLETSKVISTALEVVPEDASVAASTFLVPALFDHKEVYELETTVHRDYVEYTVIDERWQSDSYSVNDYLNNDIYETVVYEPGRIAIFRNKTVSH